MIDDIASWVTANIGPQLRLLRESHGLSRRDVAVTMGVSLATVRRMETTNGGHFSLKHLVAYCQACKVMPLDMVMRPIPPLRQMNLHVRPLGEER